MSGWLRGLLLVLGCGVGSASLGLSLEEGIAAFESRDYALAFDVLDELSDRGDQRATFYLSLLYQKGLGVIANREYALRLLKKAAEGGDPLAQYNLGNRYSRESALGPDVGKAVYWWEKAAQQGLALAQHNLGSLYALGRGVERDLEKARYWYARAAENGSARSAEALRMLQGAEGHAPRPPESKGPATPRQPQIHSVTRAWIDAQADGRFTLQIAALRERSDVERLANRHRWQRPLLVYRIGAGDRMLWALGYGVFADAAGARRALPELPGALRKANPWPRSLVDIRKRL